ncbi:hypothetical protein GCK72_004524 [Caenorhabditis remanei]|uniref:Nuclear receptor domain-containing protein n=1 Tax=Caenorhabditis remanei TaxID=31234 RepID=A0A6A5HBF6_CAERE|nr:hypothetical protein GCK72_004521 [Caenorhabditis remanei]XP_053588926.1 hypothetical protein GCK72_004524 [Caenorhabditis remanei]KAF1764572.1 hypothetical protein GCK72_004521 [Caenorhabditis remanei]KAF1764575.1 hypothetical protein GCK72_004524 [Caenorhabditis remanei]
MKKLQSKCAICLGVGDGFHFGAEACKACAAFFRRSISQKKTYACKEANSCDLVNNARYMCQSCRLSKCLEVGMNPMGVQAKLTPKSYSELSQASLLTLTLPTSFNDHMPLLSKMRSNYQKLCDARNVIHRKECENLFRLKRFRER